MESLLQTLETSLDGVSLVKEVWYWVQISVDPTALIKLLWVLRVGEGGAGLHCWCAASIQPVPSRLAFISLVHLQTQGRWHIFAGSDE